MHVGHSYQTTYTMEDHCITRTLQQIEEEKDLGVYTTSDLKSSTQCNKAANKAMSILRIVNRAFKRLDKEEFLVIYKSFTRTHLEYCVQTTELEPTFCQGRRSTGEGSEKGNKIC